MVKADSNIIPTSTPNLCERSELRPMVATPSAMSVIANRSNIPRVNALCHAVVANLQRQCRITLKP